MATITKQGQKGNLTKLDLDYKGTKDGEDQVKNYLEIVQQKIGFIPNVLAAFAKFPKQFEGFTKLYNALMLGESGLTKLEREMIAVTVSSENHCFYCLVAHGSAVRELSNDPQLGERIAANFKSAELPKKQEELLSETLKKIDIVICTALIPGKKAPVIIKEDMINNMQAGSVIYDLAAIQGGNTAFTKADEIIEKNGVKIMGESNILNRLPVSASNLYAKNMFNFIENLYDKEKKEININLEDEIISKTLIK